MMTLRKHSKDTHFHIVYASTHIRTHLPNFRYDQNLVVKEKKALYAEKKVSCS